MAAPSPPRLFAAWRVEASFFSAAFLCGDIFKLPFFMCSRLSPHNQVSHCEGIVETQCSRPYDTLSCYFHTALWLGKCQSVLMQAQHSSESDIACYRIFHVGSLTCSEVGPVSLEWPLASTRRARPFSSFDAAGRGESSENAHFAPPQLRWRRDALQPPEVQ